MTMWIICTCSGGGRKSFYDRAWKWKLLMTPRVLAFKRNPFSRAAVSHLLPRTPAGLPVTWKEFYFHFCWLLWPHPDDKWGPTSSHKTVSKSLCSRQYVATCQGSTYQIKRARREVLHYFMFPGVSSELIALVFFVKCFSKCAYLWTFTKLQDNKEKGNRILRPEIHLSTLLFTILLSFPLPLSLETRWWNLPQPADNSGHSIRRM